jgi:hypothetical protein
LAISVTPQAFKGAIDRYVKKTRYDMTQFFGRDFLPCVLPEVLSERDLIDVARIHFPELGANHLGYIANEARLSQNYLQAVEAIARRSRFLAARRGGAVKLKDILTAVSEVLSRQPIGANEAARNADLEPLEEAPRLARPASERLVKPSLRPVERGIGPAGIGTGSSRGLQSGSLLGDRASRISPELVPVEA